MFDSVIGLKEKYRKREPILGVSILNCVQNTEIWVSRFY